MTTSDEVTTFSINLFCLIFSLFDKSRFISIQWDDYFQTSLVGGRIVENFSTCAVGWAFLANANPEWLDR